MEIMIKGSAKKVTLPSSLELKLSYLKDRASKYVQFKIFTSHAQKGGLTFQLIGDLEIIKDSDLQLEQEEVAVALFEINIPVLVNY